MTKLQITRRTALSYTMAAASSAMVGGAGAQSPATVKIGTVVPLSGPFAAIGQNIKAGAEMAIEDINAAGGIKSLGGGKNCSGGGRRGGFGREGQKCSAATAGTRANPDWRLW